MSDRTDFLAALDNFVLYEGARTPDGYGRSNSMIWRGQVPLMKAVSCCLHSTPDPEHVSWLAYLDRFLVDAFNQIRTQPRFRATRASYEMETGQAVPDLFEAHLGGLHRLMMLQWLTRLCGNLSGATWVQAKLEAAFGAQSAVVDQAWRRFVGHAYKPMMARIGKEHHRTNSGRFGATTLTTYAIAGRVLFTFKRDDEHSSIQYVADDSDMVGIRSGPNTTTTRYDVCVSMIEEVREAWDLDRMLPAG